MGLELGLGLGFALREAHVLQEDPSALLGEAV